MALCAGFFSLFATACKERTTVKPDLIPPVDGINTVEVKDFDITIQNSYFDSLRANEYTYPVVGLGRINNDLFFGKTAAGVYMQFVPPKDNFTFENLSQIDSVVLVMPYLNLAFGDTAVADLNNSLALKAHEITAGDFIFDATTIWYSPRQFQYNTSNWGTGNVTLKSLNDTLHLANGDTVSNILRLKLNNSFFSYINSFSPSDLASSAAFLSRFKGLFLGPDTLQNKNTLAYFALSGGSSSNVNYQRAHLAFYYHVSTDTLLKRAIFPYTDICASSNNIIRNYTGYPAASFLNSTANRDSILIQGYPGFRTDITIKLDSKIPASIINKASLVITVLKTGDENRFNPPPQLIITKVNDDGTTSSIADVVDGSGASNSAALAFVDGKPKVVKIDGVDHFQYTVNVPREVQRTMSEGKTQMKLRVASSQAYPAAFRLIAAGSNAPEETKLKFNVIYTKQN